MLKATLSILFLLLLAATAKSAQLVSACVMSEEKQDIVGKNLDTLIPIASVSKIYTSLMAATHFDLNDRFYTQIYVTPISTGLFDVHLQGSLDPYFNKFKMHMIISKLNEMKVTKVRNFTFDQNVKYLYETDISRGFYAGKTLIQPLTLKASLEFPYPDVVSTEFGQMNQILKSYPESFKLAAAGGIHLFKNPVLKISKITYLPKRQFVASVNVRKIYVASQNISNVLKSMNWNSNNHAANQIFMASGGQDYFNELFYIKFKQSRDDLVFFNGSGQNHDLTGEGRVYNKATCRNVIRTLRALNKAAGVQKHELFDIMSVVGVDRGSTVGGSTYTNPLTTGSVIAKTGTVGTNVALAGLASTKTGLYYFMFNTEVRNSKAAEANRARRLISAELQKLIKTKGGPVKFKYEKQNPLNDNLENYEENDMIGPDWPEIDNALTEQRASK
jgi:D-alanyl-D-alanine carboxypeptidase